MQGQEQNRPEPGQSSDAPRVPLGCGQLSHTRSARLSGTWWLVAALSWSRLSWGAKPTLGRGHGRLCTHCSLGLRSGEAAEALGTRPRSCCSEGSSLSDSLTQAE